MDESLHVIWQFKKMPELEYDGRTYVGIENPYVDFLLNAQGNLTLLNYDGTKVEVDPETGEILNDPMVSHIGRRPW